MKGNRKAEVAKLAGAEIKSVFPVSADEVARTQDKAVPARILKAATERPASWWYCMGRYYLDDPDFGPVAELRSLAWDIVEGLVAGPVRPNIAEGVTAVEKTPINDLLISINFYISTGDHIGEGTVHIEGGEVTVLVPVSKTETIDIADWERLASRLDQLRDSGFPVTHSAPPTGMPPSYPFALHIVQLAESDMPKLTVLLRAEPGPMGWGSGQPDVEALVRQTR